MMSLLQLPENQKEWFENLAADLVEKEDQEDTEVLAPWKLLPAALYKTRTMCHHQSLRFLLPIRLLLEALIKRSRLVGDRQVH
jgi:hypothetical protein